MILQQNSLPPYFTDHDECEQLGDRQQSMNHGIGGHFCTQANSICVNTLGSYKCKLHGKKVLWKKTNFSSSNSTLEKVSMTSNNRILTRRSLNYYMPFLKKRKRKWWFLKKRGATKNIILGGKLTFVKKIQILYLYFNIAKPSFYPKVSPLCCCSFNREILCKFSCST